MTSSEKQLNSNQSRWDYSIQRFKENRDVFLERGLFSIVFLAHGRTALTRYCLESTLKATNLYPGEIEWIFVENGNDNNNLNLFTSLNLQRKVVISQRNYGINEGLNQGLAISRGEYVMIHENDWEALCIVDFMSIAKQIFEEHPDVGMIQLRDPRDPNENFGFGKPEYNPWSCLQSELDKSNISVSIYTTKDGYRYLVSNFPNGFNNNPIIIRKSIYRECGPYPEPEMGTDPRHGETEYQERVAKHGCLTAYIGVPIYRHRGSIQTKGT